MQTHLAHIQFNVRLANVPFYRDLMAYLGWQTLYETEDMLGVAGQVDESRCRAVIGAVQPSYNRSQARATA